MATEITAPVHAKGVVHKQIAEVAKGLAGEFWEQMATGSKGRGGLSLKSARGANRFYKQNPDREAFVTFSWPKFVDTARQSMVLLLTKPGFPDLAKMDVREALLLDGTINPKRMSPEAAEAEAKALKFIHPKR